MPRRRYKPEEIVAKLRQVDVLVSHGQSMAAAVGYRLLKSALGHKETFTSAVGMSA